MKKVVFLVTGLNSGGLENYLLRFITFYKGDLQATVICKGGYFGDLKKDFDDIGAKIIPLKIGYFNPVKFYQLYKVLKRGDFDSVCDFSGNFATVPLYLANLAGIKKRIAFHRGSNNRFKETPVKLIYNKVMNRQLPSVATAVLANSKTAMDFFHNGIWGDDSKFEVIYNGLDASEFLNSRENLREELQIPIDAFVVGHVGRYNEAKNHKTIIEVARTLCEKHAEIYFVLCGKTVDDHFNEIVHLENLSNQIKLLGFRRDIIKVLNTLDCFYFPSVAEGQPNALIEAMLVGIPFVASNIQPIKETVPFEFHDQLIPPLDIEKAGNRIMNIKQRKDKNNHKELSDWARDYFEPKRWFTKFFEKL